jgi:hypothetical protein
MFSTREPRSRLALLVAWVCCSASCTFDGTGIAGPTDVPDGGASFDLDWVEPDSATVDSRQPADTAPTRDRGEDSADAAPISDQGRADTRPGRCEQWRPRHFDPCDFLQSGAIVLEAPGAYIYDTDQGTLSSPEGKPIDHARHFVFATGKPTQRMVFADRITIEAGATLRVIGALPLLLAAYETIVVHGKLDAGSSVGAGGAGADPPPPSCGAHAATPGSSSDAGGGGGGGGGFAGRGGDGGAGGSSGQGPGGAGGPAVAPDDTVQGGCPGAAGGPGDDGQAAGGIGGGAVQLSAGNRITISGTIHAGGQGGRGAGEDGGGGGGGSGGYIGVEAPTVELSPSAVLAANGGGGGCGANDDSGAAGNDGHPAAEAAPGGQGCSGGAGGAGSSRATLEGTSGGDSSDGAGGGGGGAGVIFIWASQPKIDAGSTVSPPARP